MFCPNCGARNSEADTHCQKCGFNLKDTVGAKFKGTMLMMNDAAGGPGGSASSPPQAGPDLGAQQRVPQPAGAAGHQQARQAEARPANPPQTAVAGSGKAQALSPEEARRMRSKLKGTMIGVAPPGMGTFKPSGGTAATSGNVPPAPAAAPPRPRQPTPGVPSAGHSTPGGFVSRGGGTMIGTGIGPSGLTQTAPAPGPTAPGPTVPGPTVPGPSSSGPTVPGPAVPGPTVPGPAVPGPTVPGPTVPGPTASAEQASQMEFGGPGTVRSQPDSPGIPGSDPIVQHDQVSALGGTRMTQGTAAHAQPPVNPLGGTMLTGKPSSSPTTDSMAHAQPQFGPSAGTRTGTPAMGLPAVNAETSTPYPQQQAPYQQQAPLSQDPDVSPYLKGESKVMVVLLTILTGGLYLVYRRFAANKSRSK